MPDKCTSSDLLARIVAIETSLKALREVLDERNKRYELRASNQDSAVRSALDTSEKAIVKAETATERRFEGVNEFRQTLADQATRLMPRAEYMVQHQSLADKIETNESRLNQLQSDVSGFLARGAGIKDVWGYIGLIAGLIIAAVAGVYFHH